MRLGDMDVSSEKGVLLYFGPSGIGDWCFIYPSLANLVKGFGLSGAVVVIPRRNQGNLLLAENRLIRRVLYLHRKTKLSLVPSYGVRLLHKTLHVREITAYVAAISYLSNQPDMLLLAYLSGAGIRIGRYMKGSFLERLAITHPVQVRGNEGKVKIHDKYVTQTLGAQVNSNIPPLFPPSLFEDDVSFLTSLGLQPNRYIALGIGGGRNSTWRFWPAHYYKEIVKQLPEWTFVLLGGGREDKAQAYSMYPLPENCMDLVDVTTMNDAIKIIANAFLVVGNDSGIANIAATLGRHTITIYGPTSPELTGPALLGAYGISPFVECSPCFLDDQDATRARRCRRRKCLESILPDQVLGVLEDFL